MMTRTVRMLVKAVPCKENGFNENKVIEACGSDAVVEITDFDLDGIVAQADEYKERMNNNLNKGYVGFSVLDN